MNRRAKGNRTENLGVKELEQEGFLVYRVRGSSNRFNRDNDIFGLFDILAIKCYEAETEVKLLQIKTNAKPKLNDFISFKLNYPDIFVEVWVRKDARWSKGKLIKAHWNKIII